MMIKIKFFQGSAIAIVISALLCACNGAANSSNQTAETQYPSFNYAKVGVALNPDYSVNNLFVSGDKVYLSLADQDESTFGYAEISKNASSSDNYQTVYLTMPTDHQYSLIGDMTVNQDDSILYVPVAYLSGNSYNYTWLKYKPAATTSFDSVGNFLVSSESSAQFALKSASFSDGVVYANYAGNLVGFSESGSKELFKDSQLLLSWQDSFAISKNWMIAINDNDNGLVRVSLDNKNRAQIGEDFVALANKGFEAMPKFTIYNHIIYILAIHRTGSSQTPHLALCSISDAADVNTGWDCKVGVNSLTMGSQLINLDVDKYTGKLYFISHSLANGSQLYVIN